MLKKKLIVLVVLLIGLLTFSLVIGCSQPCNHSWGKWTSAGTAEHERECSKCGEKETQAHKFDTSTYKSNETTHWHECTECGARDTQLNHTFNSDDICTTCLFSKGLQFEAVNGGEAYYVVGIGESSEENLEIPATYNGKPITGIGERAFYYQSSIKSITMPASVTYIGSYAFQGCSGLESINLHDAVTYIGDGAFQGCVNLPYAEENNAKYLGTSANAHFALIEAIDINGDSCVINAETKIIAGGAFKGCAELLEINVPNSVTVIGEWAFDNCSRLSNVTLGNSVEVIGEGAFQNCINLTNITIPSSVKTIENSAFNLCYKLIEVVNLSNIAITANPNSTANGSIGKYAKNVCKSASESKLTTDTDGFTFYKGDEVYLLAYVGSDTDISLPADFDGASYSLSDYAFYMNTDIVKADLSATTSIGANAFDGCYNLTSVTIESVTEIKENAFNGCHKLVEIHNLSDLDIEAGSTANGNIGLYALDVYDNADETKLENDGSFIFYKGDKVYLLGHIGDEDELVLNDEDEAAYAIYAYAFYSNVNIKTVTIESGVTEIGEYAFANSVVNSVSFAETFEIADTSFEGCAIEDATIPASAAKYVNNNSLTTVVITSGAIESKALRGAKNLTTVTINEGVTSIGSEAFTDCANLTTLSIPNSIEFVGDKAFSGCTSLEYTEEKAGEVVTVQYLGNETNPHMILIEVVDKSITSYTINANTKFIYGNAFQKCEKLASIAVPEGVLSIGANAFDGCVLLESATIPATVNYIGDSAFQSCSVLTAITIPNGVEVVKASSFYRCSALATVTIPASVKEIENGAFSECKALTTISIESVEVIGNNAFANCNKLETIQLGDNLTSVGTGIFDGCESLTYTEEDGARYLGNTANPYVFLVNSDPELTSFTVKEGTRVIYHSAFAGQDKLTSLTLGANLAFIGNDAFNGCSGLTEIVIPANVVTIGSNAFRSCNTVTKITIGSKVASIGKEAFRNCSKAESITFEGTRAEWEAVEKAENWNYNNIKVICSDDQVTE